MLFSDSGVQPQHLNTILHNWSSLFKDHQTVAVIIHCFYCLISSGILEREDCFILYRKTNITSFIFPGKMFKLHSLYHEIECSGLGYLLELFVLERERYFLKKQTLMFTFTSELLRICVLICRNLPCPQKFLGTRLCTGAFF